MKRRTWAKWIKNAWFVFVLFGGSILAFHYPLRYFFPTSLVAAWSISVFVTVILFLLLMLSFWHAYHVRVVAEVKAEWSSNVPKIEMLGAYLNEGKRLYQKGFSFLSEDNAIRELKEWHESAASQIWQQLGEDAYHGFYKGSDTGKKMPTEKPEILPWINERVVALGRMVRNLKEVPAQLTAFDE